MQKPTFLQLLQIVEPEIRKRNTAFRHAIPPAKRVPTHEVRCYCTFCCSVKFSEL